MSAKVVAQLIINGVTIFSKALYSAYQQALRNAKAGGAPNAGASIIYKNKLGIDEAYKIIDVEKSALTKKILNEKYKKLFESNDPDKGGSFYLQSKVFRSKEVLDQVLKDMEAEKNNPSSSSSSSSSSTDGSDKEKKSDSSSS